MLNSNVNLKVKKQQHQQKKNTILHKVSHNPLLCCQSSVQREEEGVKRLKNAAQNRLSQCISQDRCFSFTQLVLLSINRAAFA